MNHSSRNAPPAVYGIQPVKSRNFYGGVSWRFNGKLQSLTELQKGMTLMNRNMFNRGLWESYWWPGW